MSDASSETSTTVKNTRAEEPVTSTVIRLQQKSGFKQSKVPTGHKRKASLYYYARTEKGWRYIRAQGTDDPVVNQHPGGRWFVRFRDASGEQHYKAVEGDAAAALKDAHKRSNDVQSTKLHSKTYERVWESVAAFLKHYKDAQQFEAAKKQRSTLDEFLTANPELRTVKQITSEHVYKFHDYLRAKGNADRTLHNKHKNLRVFFKWAKLDVDEITPKKSLPRYEKTEPTTYTQDEIDALLSNADEHMRLCIELGRQLGLREREMMFATFDDIQPNRTFRVQGKQRYGFSIKTHEQREIPMGQKLFDLLMESKKRRPRSLILGIEKGFKVPDRQLLAKIKRVAKRAGVDESETTLHKLRRSALTAWLRSGLDIKTVQRFAGHASLESTLRYLRALDAEKLTEHVNTIF